MARFACLRRESRGEASTMGESRALRYLTIPRSWSETIVSDPAWDGRLGTAGGAVFGAALDALLRERKLDVAAFAEATGDDAPVVRRRLRVRSASRVPRSRATRRRSNSSRSSSCRRRPCSRSTSMRWVWIRSFSCRRAASATTRASTCARLTRATRSPSVTCSSATRFSRPARRHGPRRPRKTRSSTHLPAPGRLRPNGWIAVERPPLVRARVRPRR